MPFWAADVDQWLFECSANFGRCEFGKGEKLPGVSVLLKGAARGTTTDSGGKFSLDAQSGQTLVFSFIGYQTKEVLFNNQSTLDIILAEAAENLDEVVVTGLFDERKRLEASVSITTLNVKQLDRLAPTAVQIYCVMYQGFL